ncbi:MAG: hypothetical protein ACYTEQ_18175 [Planctomycetota bacterium]|jgi:hypothetical protein
MNEQIIGTCSICGGPVVVPMVFWSVVPPVPTCGRCGATKGHGPVIDMVPAQKTENAVNLRVFISDGTSGETP